MLVILKCVTSGPSTGFRVITSPLVVCVFAGVVALVTLGVSAIGVTTMPVLGVLVLKAVVPPLVEVSTFVPAVPVDWSQARSVSPLVMMPLKFALGTNRTRVFASALSSSAELLETVPMSIQFVPSVVYCHEP